MLPWRIVSSFRSGRPFPLSFGSENKRRRLFGSFFVEEPIRVLCRTLMINFVRCRWNMLDFSADEAEMPSYSGKKEAGVWVNGSFVDLKEFQSDERFNNKRVIYFSTARRMLRTWLLIAPLILILNGIALAATFGLLLAQSYISGNVAVIGSALGGIVNAVGILVLEAIYVRLAAALARWQNFRTESQYETNLIVQRFIFEFVVAYSALFCAFPFPCQFD
jgi:ABC-type multidrug transport system fused ATPase/permease subunit